MIAYNCPQRVLSLAVALFAAALLLFPGQGLATPQALGLLATNDATPLQCKGDICVGFFSTFCLEEERLPPASWRPYRPTPGSDITLVVETRDGGTIRLPAQDYANFKTRLDFTSILASVRLSDLTQFKPVRLSIDIGPMVTLLPLPSVLDNNPHTPDMLATIAGPYRKTGEQFFDHGDARSETIAMMTRMINYMPKRGRLPKVRRNAVYRDTQTTAANRHDGSSTRFETIVQGCERILAQSSARGNMRECLQYRHSVMQTEINREFWKAIGGV